MPDPDDEPDDVEDDDADEAARRRVAPWPTRRARSRKGEGFAVGNLDSIGEGPGFRKVRRALEVAELGVNAIVFPPGFAGGFHFHDEQEELYFVHQGTAEFEFGDGSKHVLGPGRARPRRRPHPSPHHQRRR